MVPARGNMLHSSSFFTAVLKQKTHMDDVLSADSDLLRQGWQFNMMLKTVKMIFHPKGRVYIMKAQYLFTSFRYFPAKKV